jgi:hypothetical protein
VSFDAIVNSRSNVGYSKPYDTEDFNRYESVVQSNINWSMQRAGWIFDEREQELNAGPEQIVDLQKIERYKCLVAQAKFYESAVWDRPVKPVTANDDYPILGIPYWITKGGTTTNAGFLGGVLSGWGTDVGGLSPTDIPEWNNYAGLYTEVTPADLIAKVRTAMDLCGFEAPVPAPSGAMHPGKPRFTLHTNQRVKQALENLIINQNTDNGNDLASRDGKVTIRGVPVEYVPYLDNDATDPLYGIDWDTMKWAVKGNWFMKETKIGRHPRNEMVMVGRFHSIDQLFCENRRNNFVFATQTTYPI